MSLISKFDEVLLYIKEYLSGCKKFEVKRHELKLPLMNEIHVGSDLFTTQNLIYLQLVSKMYLLYDAPSDPNNLISKCFLKDVQNLECSTLRNYYTYKEFIIISSVICSLSDSKYVLVLSDLSYEILNNFIQTDTITKAFWFKHLCPMIIISSSVYQVQTDNLHSKLFRLSSGDSAKSDSANVLEKELLRLLSAISSINKKVPVHHEYTFWIFKLQGLMFAVLIPRYKAPKDTLINIWPIVPVCSFYNPNNFINNLKISENEKTVIRIFTNLVNILKQEKNAGKQDIKVQNLKEEISNGITITSILQNKITLNALYVTFFMEFIQENDHFKYTVDSSDTVTNLKCQHCSGSFNNVFDFVRHWWKVKEKLIFRCHICDDRFINLSNLCFHYRNCHYNFLFLKSQRSSTKIQQYNSNSKYNYDLYSEDNFVSLQIRQCPLCKMWKESLNMMRLHLRHNHTNDLISLYINKSRQIYDEEIKMINIPKAVRDNLTWEDFMRYCNYKVKCPFCKSWTEHNKCEAKIYTDWNLLLTHIATNHGESQFPDENRNSSKNIIPFKTFGTFRNLLLSKSVDNMKKDVNLLNEINTQRRIESNSSMYFYHTTY